MRVDPAIAALRSDRSPQQRAQAAMFAARDAWRRQARVAPVLAQLEDFGRGQPLAECPDLSRLFAEGGTAEAFAAGLCSAFAATLADEPFGQLPFRHGFDGVLSTLLLARSGTARLSLVSFEPGERHSESATFSDATRRDAVIAGCATGRLTARSAGGAIGSERVVIASGDSLALDLSRQALLVERVERRLVVLRLHRDAPAPRPTCEYALNDGRLLQKSAGDIRHSRQQAMLAVLGRMKRGDAAPIMSEMSGEDRPEELRWEALREALALDTATGFAALASIARSPLDPLAAPAGALRAQLIEAHPELCALEEAPCRAS